MSNHIIPANRHLPNTDDVPYNAPDNDIHKALASAGLVDISSYFCQRPWRRLYACPGFDDQWNNFLPTIKVGKGQASALSQATDELRFFCDGSAYRNPVDTHPLDPLASRCWALKTPDVRLYGWFAEINVFVVHSIGNANTSHGKRGHQKVTATVGIIAAYRSSLPEAAQKHVTGSTLRNVFTNRIR
ncbi:hypothetical protein [Acetobacter sp.]|uniref:hypothetical protein n=1 Tax=Acetobacter sp. TaxID=440 RepID=UPI002588F1E1|nr:hypothetical protein [Acetobacter sp.]MCC6104748.1 hypothetical protein [Acetobacter sp.]